MNYEETMRYGAAQYADVLAALSEAGLPAEFTQTGGMCAAIQVPMEGGAYLLVTDVEDTLAWERGEHRGWGVGLYDDEEHHDGARAYGESEDGSVEALVPLIMAVMKQGHQPAQPGEGR